LDQKVLYALPVIVFGLMAIGFALYLAKNVLSKDQGTPGMQDIPESSVSNHFRSGNRHRHLDGCAGCDL
jgi:Na+/H+-translocating membrane pyrophosphatase